MTQVRLACSHQTSDPAAANLLFADSVKFVLTVGCRWRTHAVVLGSGGHGNT
jgi:hypothetical protein